MDTPIEVIKTTETYDVDSAGTVVPKYRIVWKASDLDGPFIDYFPRAGFSADEAKRKLEDHARELRRLRA